MRSAVLTPLFCWHPKVLVGAPSPRIISPHSSTNIVVDFSPFDDGHNKQTPSRVVRVEDSTN